MTNRDSLVLTESLQLSEAEEILLSQYWDGECGFLARRRAEKLMRSSAAARSFIDALKGLHSDCRSYEAENGPKVDLWQRIEARIDAEEQAAFYLGERRREERSERFFSRLWSRQAAWGGLSGAVVATSALVFLAVPRPKSVTAPAQPFYQAAVGGFAASPASLPHSSRPTMEVDWMRSNGSLKLFQDPSGKSATIWVRRQPGTGSSLKAARSTPLFKPTPYLYLDGQRR